MKNEPNNVRPKAAPIKRINGSKVCKDGLEVLCLLPNINTRWVSAVERFLRRAKKKKNAHFAENKCKCSAAKFRLGFIRFLSGSRTLWIPFFKAVSICEHAAHKPQTSHTRRWINPPGCPAANTSFWAPSNPHTILTICVPCLLGITAVPVERAEIQFHLYHLFYAFYATSCQCALLCHIHLKVVDEDVTYKTRNQYIKRDKVGKISCTWVVYTAELAPVIVM